MEVLHCLCRLDLVRILLLLLLRHRDQEREYRCTLDYAKPDIMFQRTLEETAALFDGEDAVDKIAHHAGHMEVKYDSDEKSSV